MIKRKMRKFLSVVLAVLMLYPAFSMIISAQEDENDILQSWVDQMYSKGKCLEDGSFSTGAYSYKLPELTSHESEFKWDVNELISLVSENYDMKHDYNSEYTNKDTDIENYEPYKYPYRFDEVPAEDVHFFENNYTFAFSLYGLKANGGFKDDPIVNIIPKELFYIPGQHLYIGKEYGLFLNVRKEKYSDTPIEKIFRKATSKWYKEFFNICDLIVDVLVFDIDHNLPDFSSPDKQRGTYTVNVLFNYSYFALKRSDYTNRKYDFDIPLAEGVDKAVIYNPYTHLGCYDFVLTNASVLLNVENQYTLNDCDSGYNPNKDNGTFFTQSSCESTANRFGDKRTTKSRYDWINTLSDATELGFDHGMELVKKAIYGSTTALMEGSALSGNPIGIALSISREVGEFFYTALSGYSEIIIEPNEISNIDNSISVTYYNSREAQLKNYKVKDTEESHYIRQLYTPIILKEGETYSEPVFHGGQNQGFSVNYMLFSSDNKDYLMTSQLSLTVIDYQLIQESDSDDEAKTVLKEGLSAAQWNNDSEINKIDEVLIPERGCSIQTSTDSKCIVPIKVTLPGKYHFSTIIHNNDSEMKIVDATEQAAWVDKGEFIKEAMQDCSFSSETGDEEEYIDINMLPNHFYYLIIEKGHSSSDGTISVTYTQNCNSCEIVNDYSYNKYPSLSFITPAPIPNLNSMGTLANPLSNPMASSINMILGVGATKEKASFFTAMQPTNMYRINYFPGYSGYYDFLVSGNKSNSVYYLVSDQDGLIAEGTVPSSSTNYSIKEYLENGKSYHLLYLWEKGANCQYEFSVKPSRADDYYDLLSGNMVQIDLGKEYSFTGAQNKKTYRFIVPYTGIYDFSAYDVSGGAPVLTLSDYYNAPIGTSNGSNSDKKIRVSLKKQEIVYLTVRSMNPAMNCSCKINVKLSQDTAIRLYAFPVYHSISDPLFLSDFCKATSYCVEIPEDEAELIEIVPEKSGMANITIDNITSGTPEIMLLDEKGNIIDLEDSSLVDEYSGDRDKYGNPLSVIDFALNVVEGKKYYLQISDWYRTDEVDCQISIDGALPEIYAIPENNGSLHIMSKPTYLWIEYDEGESQTVKLKAEHTGIVQITTTCLEEGDPILSLRDSSHKELTPNTCSAVYVQEDDIDPDYTFDLNSIIKVRVEKGETYYIDINEYWGESLMCGLSVNTVCIYD